MNKLKIILIAVAAAAIFTGCTQNQRARAFGGTAVVNLPENRKLVNVEFKENNLWLLTRAAKSGEVAETYYLIEDSSFGIVEGEVKLIETINIK